MALGFQDNVGNILGANTASNLYDSSTVTADADGSIIERLEALKDSVAAVGSKPGNFAWGVVNAGTTSTTTIPISGLIGYGDDYFNHEYYMQIVKNASSPNSAPEKQVRQITKYVSATGTFTCTAFSSAVEANDICLILHESIVAIGRNDADNIFASDTVAANADGSILERLEYIQGLVGGTDGASNILGANDADNGFDSSAVVANADGSLVERLEYLQGELGASVGASISADIAAVKAETANIAAVKTETDKLAGFIAGGGIGSGIVRKTVTFSNTGEDVALFTITGDVIVRLVAVCGTSVESAGGANIGVDCGSVAIIADTDCTTLEAGDIWHDNSPDASAEATSTMREYIIANGTDIALDIENAKQVDSGVINFYCIWTALSTNGAVAAA